MLVRSEPHHDCPQKPIFGKIEGALRFVAREALRFGLAQRQRQRADRAPAEACAQPWRLIGPADRPRP
jgi:hypothetical protein